MKKLWVWVTKDEYESTLRAHQQINKEMKSDERDKAALVYSLTRNVLSRDS